MLVRKQSAGKQAVWQRLNNNLKHIVVAQQPTQPMFFLIYLHPLPLGSIHV
jgi:hypothetical protein